MDGWLEREETSGEERRCEREDTDAGRLDTPRHESWDVKRIDGTRKSRRVARRLHEREKR